MPPVLTLRRRPEGLQIMRRGDREAVEVAIPFVLRDGARKLVGQRLSLHRIEVTADEISRIGFGAPVRDVEIQVALEGFEIVLPVRVGPSAAGRAEAGRESFDIVGMDERTEATLAQLIRTSLTGWLPAADELTELWDAETPQHHAAGSNPIRAGAHWAGLAAALLLLVGGVAVAAYQGYLYFATVRSTNAAVTAERLDIVSPEYGTVAEGAVAAGTRVTPGQPLVRVHSDMVETTIALEGSGIDDTAVARLTSIVDRERASGRLDALNRRLAALTFTSRCTCTVLWSAPPGVAVAPGALLMSLVVSDPAQIRVEAAIRPGDALSVRPGQEADITFSGDDLVHRAVVETVRFNSLPIPKVGLATQRGMVTVSLLLRQPDLALVPGRPASVVIKK